MVVAEEDVSSGGRREGAFDHLREKSRVPGLQEVDGVQCLQGLSLTSFEIEPRVDDDGWRRRSRLSNLPEKIPSIDPSDRRPDVHDEEIDSVDLEELQNLLSGLDDDLVSFPESVSKDLTKRLSDTFVSICRKNHRLCFHGLTLRLRKGEVRLAILS